MNTKDEMDLRVADNEGSKWTEQVQDYVYWKAFKLTVLNLTILLQGH